MPEYKQCYTFGYRSVANPFNLVKAVDATGGLLVDIRYAPNYGNPLYSKASLLNLCSAVDPTTKKSTRACNYLHLGNLGNVRYDQLNKQDWKLRNQAAGISAVDFFLREHPLTLVCACLEYESCHRSFVSKLLAEKLGVVTQELRVDVVELSPGKCWALSCHQPWATLLVQGLKTWEVRSWPATFRGPLLIHSGSLDISRKFHGGQAGLSDCYDAYEDVLATLGYGRFEDLPFGRIIGEVVVEDCFRIGTGAEQEAAFTPTQRRFSSIVEGHYAWRLSSSRVFRHPPPARGASGLWETERPYEPPAAEPAASGYPEEQAARKRNLPAKAEETLSLF